MKPKRWQNLLRFQRDGSGQALVELAVLTPLLILLLLGIIELGRLADYNIVASSAARAGVQYGQRNMITAADKAGMETAALAGANNFPGLSAVATSYCTCADGSAASCQVTACATTRRLVYIRVTASATFAPLFNYPGLPGSVQVSRPATMQVAP